MKIGVLSDTHSRALPSQMLKDFKQVDLIIHAGDFCTQDDFKVLEKIQPVKAVYGNMDTLDIRKHFSRRQILKIEGFSIGLMHGEGSPEKALDMIQAEFHKDKVQAVIFGHSHYPCNEVIKGVLYFNPGSPNDRIFSPFRSYGILEVGPQGIHGKIIEVQDEE